MLIRNPDAAANNPAYPASPCAAAIKIPRVNTTNIYPMLPK